MKFYLVTVPACATALAVLGGVAAAQTAGPSPETATARLLDPKLAEIGTVELTQTPHGVLVRAVVEGLEPGTHGFHIHETGECEPPFESAGGHFNPTGAEHGFLVAAGPHAGDMVNLNVPEGGGEVVYETLNTMVTLAGGENALLDEDGSAIVVHAGADDYSSQPSGHAGDRLACGVIETIGDESR
jgi:Cu-Zn family superoxide dismutase